MPPLAKLPGEVAIGHTRYSTTGEVALRNIQPLFADFEFGGFAVGLIIKLILPQSH